MGQPDRSAVPGEPRRHGIGGPRAACPSRRSGRARRTTRTARPPSSSSGRRFLAEPGRRIALRWNASDDGTLTTQRILFSREGDHPASYSVLATLPAGQRTFEWTVPSVGFQVTGGRASIRIEAVDETGQVGWDAYSPNIPSERVARPVTLTSSPTGTLTGGTTTQACFTASSDGNTVEGYLFLDGDQRMIPLGGWMTEGGCLRADLPFVSTDSARIGLKLHGSTNDFAWTFTPTFAIRPDARVGDAAPDGGRHRPATGSTFTPGAVVPISWSASDDEGVRGFTVQASYDDGRTWHELAAELPASTRTLQLADADGQWARAGATAGDRARPALPDRRPRPRPSRSARPRRATAATQTDTVTIPTAEYRPTRRALRIEATSTRADARLVASVTATGQVIGTLTPTGDGRHTGAFSWGTDPRQITVRSSAGATRRR